MSEANFNDLKQWLEQNALQFDYGQSYSGIADLSLEQLKELKILVEESIYEKIENNRESD